MTETAAAAPAKATTQYEAVKMLDGRTVQFPGKRQIDKTPLLDEAAGRAGVQFDFRNGETITVWSNELPADIQLRALAHGLAQKLGDEAAGVQDIDDIVVAVDDMAKRLRAGAWKVEREGSGDSFSGANIVIKAVAEAAGKTIEEAKNFLNAKLEASKKDAAEKGTKPLSRQELYAAFRKPGTKTAAIIDRLEGEKKTKAARVSADDLLAEIA